MYDDCEHEYSWDCECECDHWCWHTHEWECRENHCDCDMAQSGSVSEYEESPDIGLKEVAIFGGIALAIFGVSRFFGRKTRDSSRSENDDEFDDLPDSKAKQIEPPQGVTKIELPPAGWYQEGTKGRMRWWNGETWTEHFQSVGFTPGWYSDGAGRIRWWNGQGWTGHISDHP